MPYSRSLNLFLFGHPIISLNAILILNFCTCYEWGRFAAWLPSDKPRSGFYKTTLFLIKCKPLPCKIDIGKYLRHGICVALILHGDPENVLFWNCQFLAMGSWSMLRLRTPPKGTEPFPNYQITSLGTSHIIRPWLPLTMSPNHQFYTPPKCL